MSKKGIVFISCGQRTEEEITLGRKIVSIVDELTPFSAYFAENVNNMDGLTKSIFSKIDEAIGFIFVMHNRGSVKVGEETFIRGSVWIEQEIAIAAFLRQIQSRNVHSIAFIERGLEDEGVREYLHLNPTIFHNNKEIIAHLADVLPSWSISDVNKYGSALIPIVNYEKQKIAHDRHDYHLVVNLKNIGSTKIDDFRIDIEIPRNILDPNHNSVLTTHSTSRTHQLFRVTSDRFYNRLPIYITEEKEVARIPYYINHDTYESQDFIKVSVFSGDMEPQIYERKVSEMNSF